MNPLTPLALIIVMVTAPIHYALEYPLISILLLIVLAFIAFSLYVKGVQRRARRKFDAEIAADEHQKQLIREVIAEEKPRRFRNF